MSYILDALKKAEAQRALGALPNIHAPAAFAAAPSDRAPLRRRAARWGGLAALLAILAALAWLRPWQPGTALPQAQARKPATVVATTPPATPALPPSTRTPLAPQRKTVPPPASKPSKPKAAASTAPRPIAAAPLVQKPALPAAAATDAPEPELQTLDELPPQIQRAIPALVISGYIYSGNRAERSLLVNNQLLREGDTVAPGLVLEKMLRGAVVLNYHGYRYRMPY
ncbi:general secretion pathway protein GspB [Herminiimonas sp. CN]|uniref:general secretion pathway protein GspB n=1 Tax=Herminiimonas sp. CN TaxID=1349818 RepID=UPI0004737FBC|nr:general secretion pathway protein GspB [Herminiimonas sp. CN]